MADLLNLARQQTITTGPGTVVLGPVVTGFISWAAAGAVDGQEYSYGIEQGNQREQGRGVYNAATQELTRNVLKSTNNDEPLDLDGTAQVVCTPAAEDFLSTALEITFTPVGNLASTNVQDVLEELDTEKEAVGTAASVVADHEASGIHTAIRYNGAYVLPLNTDLDTITEAGFYLVQSPVNSPEGLAGYFYVDMQRHPTLAEYRLQTAHQMSTSSSPRWYRQRFGATWGAWQKVSLTGHTHAIADVTDLQTELDDKASLSLVNVFADAQIIRDNSPNLQYESPSGVKRYRQRASISDTNDFGWQVDWWDGATWVNLLIASNSLFYYKGKDVYREDNILGTVSQSDGVPTGAIIERGSNANGDYVKFADGTLFCFSHIDLTSDAWTSASGSLFYGSSLTWTFPVAFVSTTNLAVEGATERNSVVPSGVYSTGLAPGWSFWRAWATVSVASGTAKGVRLFAVGRWF